MDADTKPESVEHRHSCEHACTGLNAVPHGAGLQREGVEVEIAQQNSLGNARCAAGKENHRGVCAAAHGKAGFIRRFCNLEEVFPVQTKISKTIPQSPEFFL